MKFSWLFDRYSFSIERDIDVLSYNNTLNTKIVLDDRTIILLSGNINHVAVKVFKRFGFLPIYFAPLHLPDDSLMFYWQLIRAVISDNDSSLSNYEEIVLRIFNDPRNVAYERQLVTFPQVEKTTKRRLIYSPKHLRISSVW